MAQVTAAAAHQTYHGTRSEVMETALAVNPILSSAIAIID
jgi:hypothetical protein